MHKSEFSNRSILVQAIHDRWYKSAGMRLTQERLTLIAFLVILDDLRQKPQIVQHSCLGQQ
jgi:hypothetical protein